MTHLCVREWGRIAVGSDGGFTRTQANGLLAAARAHPRGGDEGTAILTDHHGFLKARQVVGVIAASGCSLEILPKVDPDHPDEDRPTVRGRLVQMLDVALGLDLDHGSEATMARQSDSLLDILIRVFADRLLAEARRGLPRAYLAMEEDLPTLRGRLNVQAQFTRNAVRPDRLACRYDVLSSDIPLMQVMKAAVVFLTHHARAPETRRRLDELRFVMADIRDVPLSTLPWNSIHIDRTNRSWAALLKLARLFLRREWQATHYDTRHDGGITLLFAMNDLFEAYVAALLRRAMTEPGVEVVAQGGLRYCLGEWSPDGDCRGTTFQTRPDILIRNAGKVLAIIDTKWKALTDDPLDRKKGIAQSDVYQMMAYARLYDCNRLMLLYPAASGRKSGIGRYFGLDRGTELLALGRLDITTDLSSVQNALFLMQLELRHPFSKLRNLNEWLSSGRV